jgi:hypothetical protein
MPQLNSFVNKHKDQMAFIVAAGPSLHFQNVLPLKEYVTFTVNSGILKIPQCDYFVTDDPAVADWNYFQLTARSSRSIKLLYSKLENDVSHLDPEKIVWYDHIEGHSPFDPNVRDGYQMTAEGPIAAARTSAGSAVHLAYIMGCNPIVLLGCDACYKNGKRYFWQFPDERNAVRIRNPQSLHCRADKGLRQGKPVDQDCLDFLEYWRVFAKSNENRSKIIYASEGGLVDAFPSMTLKQVLTIYGDRKKT